jgi:hypothetical protein
MKFFRKFFKSRKSKKAQQRQRSVLFWEAMISLAEKDVLQATRLKDYGLLESAEERLEIAASRIEALNKD